MMIYVDGSGNGKYGFVTYPNSEVKVFEESGITCNEAEYKAIIKSLESYEDDLIDIFSDSHLAVNQLNKKWHIKNDRLRNLALQVWELCKNRTVTFNWLPRENNLAGKVLG